MKKILLALCLLASVPAWAQVENNDSIYQLLREYRQELDSLKEVVGNLTGEQKRQKVQDKWDGRAKYFNISYVNQSYTTEDGQYTFRNDFGVALTSGRTYYLHKNPILGMIKFGLDWSYLDINFSKYDLQGTAYGGNYYLPDGYDPGYSDYEEENTDMYQAEIGMQFGPSVTVNPIDRLMVNAYFRATPSFAMRYMDEEFTGKYGTFFSVGGAVAWRMISLGVEGRWGKSDWETGSTRFYVGFRF